MSGLLLTFYVILSILLVAVILLQPGAKGGGLGASFGGSGANSAFGARGSAPFLAKFTYWLAAAVMFSCLAIEVLIVKANRSVLDRGAASAAAPAPKPAAPAAPAPASVPVPASTPAPTSAHTPAPAPTAPAGATQGKAPAPRPAPVKP
jgi:preprotein translocase subunit SecG